MSNAQEEPSTTAGDEARQDEMASSTDPPSSTNAHPSTNDDRPNDVISLQFAKEQLHKYLNIAKTYWKHYKLHAAGGLLALVVTRPGRWLLWTIVLVPLYTTVWRVVGTAVGVGLGLGLAAHVYEVLSEWNDERGSLLESSSAATRPYHKLSSFNQSSSNNAVGAVNGSTTMLSNKTLAHLALEVDEQNYASFMQAAGYPIPSKILRGQVLRVDDTFFTLNHTFEHGTQALDTMHDIFPSLPLPVAKPLASLIEYILRDFVACWFAKMDVGCIYRDPANERNNLNDHDPHAMQNNAGAATAPRCMVQVVSRHFPRPLVTHLYQALSVVFGNLASRVEHVNVLELILLRWTKILAHTFKVYRVLRKQVKAKTLVHQQHTNTNHRRSSGSRGGGGSSGAGGGGVFNGPDNMETATAVSEIDMIKEFLFAGKLHRAITFGLDVPALLFADASGKECGDNVLAEPNNNRGSSRVRHRSDNEVLQARLDRVLPECELDYNRVMAHRMTRALLARQDFSSPIVGTLVTELLAGSVLTSIMSMFGPDYINDWIVKGLASPTVTDGDVVPAASGLSAEQASAKGGGDSIDAAQRKAVGPATDDSHASHVTTNGEGLQSTTSNAPLTLVRTDGNALSVGVDSATHVQSPATLVSPEAVSSPTKLQSEGEFVTELALTLIELQQHVDFEEFRASRAGNREMTVDWDESNCRSIVLRLVLLIEAAMTHGRCIFISDEPDKDEEDPDNSLLVDEDDFEGGKEVVDSERVEVTLPEYESVTLSQLLMELTSDIEAFEGRVAAENVHANEMTANDRFAGMKAVPYRPAPTEQSTIRTLIAAWLHTGQIFRIMSVLIQAQRSILAPYYQERAFLRSKENAGGFARQLKVLEGVEILVDTMTVLAAPRLDETSGDELNSLVKRSSVTGAAALADRASEQRAGNVSTALQMTNASIPRFFDFHRNEAFAASLRSERERRLQSWLQTENSEEEGPQIVSRMKGATEEDAAFHRELHHIARIFYSNTNLIAIRDASRQRNSSEQDLGSASEASESEPVAISLLTLETSAPRRRIEIPDDDSSFLLRAQPRPLNALGVHRDQRNHEQSFKVFSSTYDEPTVGANTDHYAGGRFVRRCQVRYFPVDRTAAVSLISDSRKLDQRKNKSSVPDTITVGSSARATPFLSAEFLRDRHLCQRWVPKGTSRPQSLLASSVMEPADFTSMPRSGRAIDFVYRVNLFEKPMVDLAGKHFTVHDSSSFGAHRADASALEISDASLSVALMTVGAGMSEEETLKQAVEMGKDGYPIIWMKYSRKQDDTSIEVKPYRVSFVRAALMVTAARQEAQLQSLIKCVKAGSAKKATKALTDARLRPTLRLLEHAGSASREKQSILLRDLKLGVNHIDREQLRRNGLLNPRYPTVLKDLSAVVEDAQQAEDIKGVQLYGATGIVYRIRCTAVVELIADEQELEGGDVGYRGEDGRLARIFKEEWVVFRTFKEFQAIHKHLKNQISSSESSGTAGSRLAGAASAAFTASYTQARHRQRKALLPSLSQATKVGGLGLTRKSILKRQEYLQGYLEYLLSPGHLLKFSHELALFIGSFYPLPPQVHVNKIVSGRPDPLGRTEMVRTIMQYQMPSIEAAPQNSSFPAMPSPSANARQESRGGESLGEFSDEEFEDDVGDREGSKRVKKLDMLPAIRRKIEKIPLAQVRSRIFELLRYQFGFENASFVRNRLLSGIKAASLAVTTPAEFRRTLYKLHTEQLSADALGGWIQMTLDMLWPDGVFFESKPPYTPEQLREHSDHAKAALHRAFPDALCTVLGNELTKDGLNLFHEMLQNRVVVRSMAYMLFDILWLEVFPEIGDVVHCGAALDIDST